MKKRGDGFKLDFLEEYSKEDIIRELRRISNRTRKTGVSKRDIENHGRMSYAVVNKKFGSLRQALQVAGLQHNRFMNATDDELTDIVISVWEDTLAQAGRRPYRSDVDIEKYGVSPDTIVRRFGNWKKALRAAYEASNVVEEDALPSTQDEEEPTRTRRTMSLRKRFFVLKRDEFACQICGASGAGVKLEVDHKNPVARGGSDALENLWTLCFDCNRGKRDSDI